MADDTFLEEVQPPKRKTYKRVEIVVDFNYTRGKPVDPDASDKATAAIQRVIRRELRKANIQVRDIQIVRTQ